MTTSHSEHPPAGAMDEQDMAHDDAVLDMIALEMGAPDFVEPEMDYPDIEAPGLVEPEPVPEPVVNDIDAQLENFRAPQFGLGD